MRTLVPAVIVLASIGTAGCVSVAPRPAPPAASTAEAFAGLVEAHNRERARKGLPPLAVNDRLTAAAQGHADDMAAHRRMSHRGGDGSSPFRRMSRAGYSYQSAGENVAYGQRSVGAVMSDWMRSSGHRRNILGKFSEIGAAYATDAHGTAYWCVTFGTPGGG